MLTVVISDFGGVRRTVKDSRMFYLVKKSPVFPLLGFFCAQDIWDEVLEGNITGVKGNIRSCFLSNF